MEINGIAHIQLTVNNLDRCMDFYENLLTFMGLTVVVKTSKALYCIGGKTAVAVTRSSVDQRENVFNQRRIGLHHVCFRARGRHDVDKIHEHLVIAGATIVHAPEEGPWFPGYYSVLFEDPDGIRLEVNHVPGAGYLDSDLGDNVQLPLDYFPGFGDYDDA